MKNTLLLLIIALFFGSCGNSTFKASAPRGNKGQMFEPPLRTVLIGTKSVGKKSLKTGWNYNDPSQHSFAVKSEVLLPPAPGLVFIPGGSFVMGKVQDEMSGMWNNPSRRVTVASFFIDITEVTNVDYREYLNWVNKVFIDYPEVHNKGKADEMVWRSKLGYNEPLVQNYFIYPSYNNYPIVGVSWEQAKEYCDWRTDRVNEMQLYKAQMIELDQNPTSSKYFNTEVYLAGQYDGLPTIPGADNNKKKISTIEDGILYPKYRLPTEAEWEYAALAPIAKNGSISEGKFYPWIGKVPRDNQNRFISNFKRANGDYAGVEGAGGDAGFITAPVDSYLPNDFGLYCMAGNVNEWVADVYRPLSLQDQDDFNPYRGNLFQTEVLDEEGRPVEKDEYGKIRMRDYTEEELTNRDNFRKSDYRNFKDGDYMSILDYGEEDPSEYVKGVYVKRKGNQAYISSQIDDKSRIYKGGSWRDRAYWLCPGTRRYLDQGKSTNDIGFRCAMMSINGN